MKKTFVFVLALMVCAFSYQAFAARIDMMPRKIVLEDRQRSSDLTLMNLTDKASVVRIELLSYAQQPDGTYKTLEGTLNPAFDPEKLVRISPKQFTLPPGGRQKVRLSVQKPADLPDGEYRFHVKALSFDADEFSVRRTPAKGNAVSINMNVGIVIPVVVRKGDLTGTAKIENISLLSSAQTDNKKPALKLDITRTGTAGVIGRIAVYADGEPREVGRLGNVNVFSEVKTRTIQVPLDSIPAGNLRVQYIDDSNDKGILDEVVVQR